VKEQQHQPGGERRTDLADLLPVLRGRALEQVVRAGLLHVPLVVDHDPGDEDRSVR
jgi:hypothetical protein